MKPTIFGILNVTRDSFSDGGKFFSTEDAVTHGERLASDGADVVDVGAASSHPDAEQVSAEQECRRLEPVLAALHARGIQTSIDTDQPEVQRFALANGASYLNDIHGFPNAELYPELAAADAKLIVMHAVQDQGHATRADTSPLEIVDGIVRFFDGRLDALVKGGVATDRLILDPGMGFFLGRDPRCSIEVLRAIPALKARFALPSSSPFHGSHFYRHSPVATQHRSKRRRSLPNILRSKTAPMRFGLTLPPPSSTRSASSTHCRPRLALRPHHKQEPHDPLYQPS